MKQITKKPKIFDFLSGLDLFQSLSKAQLQEVAALVELCRYKKKDIIFHEGQSASCLYIVYSGMVKIYKVSSEGREHILQTMTVKRVFAEVPMFEGGIYPASCAALEDCALIKLSRTQLLQLISKEPKIALNLLAIQAKLMREFIEQIEGLTLKDTLSRLVAYLLKNVNAHGVTQQKLSITNLAKILGMTRENLSKMLHRLVQQGVIGIEKNNITIKEKDRLIKLGK